MTCTVGASGSRVSIAITRERDCGIVPAAIAIPLDGIGATAASGGLAVFDLPAAGDAEAQGFTGGQLVEITGFAATNNNGTWRVFSASDQSLTVIDVANSITTEAGAAGQLAQIRLERLRTVSKNINPERNTLESGEISPNRMKLAQRQGFERATGSFGLELGMTNFNSIVEAALSGSYEKPLHVRAGGTLVFDARLIATPTIQPVTRNTGSFIADGFREGELVDLSGYTGAVDNIRGRITTLTALVMTVELDTAPDNLTAVLDTFAVLDYAGYRCDIGTNITTFYVERQFLDVGQFQPFVGVSFDTLGLNVQPEENVGGTSNLLGIRPLAMAQASLSPLEVVAPTTDEPFAAFDGGLFEGGTPLALLTSLEMELSNNRTLEPVVGQKFSPGIFDGTAILTGTSTVFFQDEVLYNKFFNEEASSLQVRLDTADGSNSWSIVVPRLKYTGAPMDPPQQGAVPLQMPFEALEAQVAIAGGLTRGTILTIQRTDDVAY